MKPKLYTPVTYTENEVDYAAIVIGSRILDDITGPDGDPLISVGFFKPVTTFASDGKTLIPRNVAGTADVADLVQFRYDIANESLSFDDRDPSTLEKLALIYGGVKVKGDDGNEKLKVTYPGGRWKAGPGTEEEEPPEDTEETEETPEEEDQEPEE